MSVTPHLTRGNLTEVSFPTASSLMTSETVPITTVSVNTLNISPTDSKKGVISAKADGVIGLASWIKAQVFIP